jgi:hypothetical protein
MRAVGIRLISPRRVFLDGRNPFPWPVTVRWKGLTVTKRIDSTTVIFPSGREVRVTDDAPQFVEEV